MKPKNYSNNRELASRQANFIQTLEGIGDILVFQTERRNKNTAVIEGLKRIKGIVVAFLNIQKNDPEKFDRLLLAQEFFELYRENEKEAGLRLAFDPEKYLVSFSTVINQILRIHEAAVAAKNEEISRFATYHLNWLLADLSQTPKNELFVEQLLKSLAGLTRTAAENQDRSMYAASIHWYIDIVFNRLRQKGTGFDLSYLGLFDRYFFGSVKYIVSENQTNLFQALVTSLVDGVHVPSYHKGKIWDYGHLILQSDFEKHKRLEEEHKVEKRINELASSENDLDSKQKMDEWLTKFEELKRILEPNFNPQLRDAASKIEEEIREFVEAQFKYNNLLEIVFAIGAFCLFKQRPDYIRYLWEYKQPPDSDASWVGHDIVPKTIDEVVGFYFRKGLFERKFDFWEGHHGSERYYEMSFLLLLARILQGVRESNGRYEQIENYSLPPLHVYRLSDLEHSIDGFVQLAQDLRKQTETLSALGFDLGALDDLFDKKVIPFLDGLKPKVQERIKDLQRNQRTNPKKIEAFKDEVLKGFKESAVLRDILTHYALYEDRTAEKYAGTVGRFGSNQVHEKAAFFDEWHVHYGDWGVHYGRNLASGEDLQLGQVISSTCKEIEMGDFEKTLSQFDDLGEIILLAVNGSSYSFFEGSKNFRPKWYKDTPQLGVGGYNGQYSFSGQHIPVFDVYVSDVAKQVLVLNKTKLGKLMQYSPLDEGESQELKRDIFYMRVEAFSEDIKLMEQFLSNPPPWLKEMGDTNVQREYLKERALIKILERFEFQPSKNFEGYRIGLAE